MASSKATKQSSGMFCRVFFTKGKIDRLNAALIVYKQGVLFPFNYVCQSEFRILYFKFYTLVRT
jgi:hypothetical protein